MAFHAVLLLLSTARAQEEPRLVAQLGHPVRAETAAFSPDGRWVVTGGYSGNCVLWDTASARELRRFVGHTASISHISFQDGSRRFLSADTDGTAILWDTATGQRVRTFQSCWAAHLSPDGRFVGGLASTDPGDARIWDVASGRESRRLGSFVAFTPDGQMLTRDGKDLVLAETGRRVPGHAAASSLAFTRNGRTLLTCGPDHVARLWDVATGTERLRLESEDDVFAAAVSATGRFVAMTGPRNVVELWDAGSGRDVRRFEGHEGAVDRLAFSPDERWLLTVSRSDRTVRLWDVSTGRELRWFNGLVTWVTAVGFFPDGRRFLARGWGTALWDGIGGTLVRRFATGAAGPLALSPDGETMVVSDGSGGAALRGPAPVRILSVETGEEVGRLVGHTTDPVVVAQTNVRVWTVDYSGDGRTILTAGVDGTVRLWDAATCRERRKFRIDALDAKLSPDGRWFLASMNDVSLWDATAGAEKYWIDERGYSVAFTHDSTRFAIGAEDGSVTLWPVAEKRRLARIENPSPVSKVDFAPDDATLLAACEDNTIRIWDVAGGKLLHTLEGHQQQIVDAGFTPDGERIVSVSLDGTARVWRVADGRPLAQLLAFYDGTWAAIDEEGRFDASRGGDVAGLHWVVGNEPVSLDQLKQRYYEPGLLRKAMGHDPAPRREVRGFTAPKLFPAVRLDPPSDDQPLLIHLEDRGGGIGRVVVRINGKELTADARGGRRPEGDAVTLRVPVAGDPRLKPGEDNVIEVEAYNEEGYLRSRGMRVRYVAPGTKGKDTMLWAIVAGVADYEGDEIDLRYAAKDAADFGKSLELAAKALFGVDSVHLTLLQNAGRMELIKSLQAARRAAPSDILVLYLAGHGVNYGGQDGDFYFLAREARSADLDDPSVRDTIAISSHEMTELVKQIPALKQVLILDTCASGKFIEELTGARSVPTSQVRALERLKDRTGIHVLAACSADRVSYEASRFGQGLLTYSLLLGMRGAALRENEYVDVARLFEFAADRVPQLAGEIGGTQRPVIARPGSGGSFDIGMLTDEAKTKVPVRTVRPLLVRSNFQDEDDFVDTIGLAKLVDRRLGEVSTGDDMPFVFVDAREFPDSHRLVGRYRFEGDEITVDVRLSKGRERVAGFVAKGRRTEPEALAEKIVDETRRRLP